MTLGKYSIIALSLLLALLSACNQPAGESQQDSGENGKEQAVAVQDDGSIAAAAQTAEDPADAGLPRVGSTSFKGRGECFSCHRDYVVDYRQTAHDLAGSDMDSMFVRGDFANSEFSDSMGSALFYREGEKYMVKTSPPGGTEQAYELASCLGGQSLQQYALRMGNGRIQVLDIAWDLRPAAQGGQRWFRLPAASPHERSGAADWTGWQANWNTNCARCHASELKPGYESADQSFASTVGENDVTCEACHGGGKIHIGWAEGARQGLRGQVARKGLIFYLTGQDYEWRMDEATGSARRVPPRAEHKEVETCMQCHALHDPYILEYKHDRDPFHFLDIALLTEGLYHPDGQIADVQVYETGSFLQSREYRRGVTCADCHDPHTGRTYESGNDLCLRCHSAAKFDNAQHHFHPAGSAGSRCISCHMATQTYLGVDERHDHSFRVPRPDLSQSIGSPNACSQCHTDMALQDVVVAWQDWYGTEHAPHFGTVFAAARAGDPRSVPQLEKLALDANQAPIVRATAFHELGRFASPTSVEVISAGLLESESIVRLAAVKACAGYAPQLRSDLLAPHIGDKLQAVQIEIGGLLSGLSTEGLSEDGQRAFNLCIDKYVKSQLEQPWLAINQARAGWMYGMRGMGEESAAAFAEMHRLQPLTAECFLLEAAAAQALEQQERIAGILQAGLRALPDDVELLLALGADNLRLGKDAAARKLYEQALAADPASVNAAYTVARQLADTGSHAEAIAVLEASLVDNPFSLDILRLLLGEALAVGNTERVREVRDRLAEYYPWVEIP